MSLLQQFVKVAFAPHLDTTHFSFHIGQHMVIIPIEIPIIVFSTKDNAEMLTTLNVYCYFFFKVVE